MATRKPGRVWVFLKAWPWHPVVRNSELVLAVRILITAGPTREYFDSVRFISNPSSGKMGYAIAVDAAQRGHEVVLVSGPVALPPPPGVEVVYVTSAQEMFDSVIAQFETCRACVMTAAVCDYRPEKRLSNKLKKQDCPRQISLQPTQDILAHLGKTKGGRILVGFAMEDNNEKENAEGKLRRKGCDAIVLNGLANVGSDDASVQILRADSGWGSPQSGSKQMVAQTVVSLVESLAALT